MHFTFISGVRVQVVGRLGVAIKIPHLVPAVSCGVKMPMKIELRLRSLQAMAVFVRHSLVEGITYAVFEYSLMLLRGNPRSSYPGSDDDDALASLYLLRTSLLDQGLLVEA
jgi:hypothetical protein